MKRAEQSEKKEDSINWDGMTVFTSDQVDCKYLKNVNQNCSLQCRYRIYIDCELIMEIIQVARNFIINELKL